MIIDGIDHLQQTVRAGFQHQQFDLLVVKLRVEFAHHAQTDPVFRLALTERDMALLASRISSCSRSEILTIPIDIYRNDSYIHRIQSSAGCPWHFVA